MSGGQPAAGKSLANLPPWQPCPLLSGLRAAPALAPRRSCRDAPSVVMNARLWKRELGPDRAHRGAARQEIVNRKQLLMLADLAEPLEPAVRRPSGSRQLPFTPDRRDVSVFVSVSASEKDRKIPHARSAGSRA